MLTGTVREVHSSGFTAKAIFSRSNLLIFTLLCVNLIHFTLAELIIPTTDTCIIALIMSNRAVICEMGYDVPHSKIISFHLEYAILMVTFKFENMHFFKFLYSIKSDLDNSKKHPFLAYFSPDFQYK